MLAKDKQMLVACIELEGLGSIQAFPLILFTKDGKHDGLGGVYASRPAGTH
jgi:hypothetical protein